MSATTAWQIYHASLAGLISEGERCGRLNRRGQLTIQLPTSTVSLPIVCLGLPWEASEIGKIIVIEPTTPSKLENYHAYAGFGLPIVAVREAGNCPTAADQFLVKQLPFAATVVLRPPSSASEAGALEFYSPLQFHSIGLQGQTVPLARNISAPFDYALQTTARTGVLGFLDPGVPEQDEGLRFIEPYQPGKIPVVFVHGLLSDPTTWFDVANDLQNQSWFNEHYQIGAFRYATGKPFITSAMYLRDQMRKAVEVFDPQHNDPAMQRMVLIGHSMGGLVAKLQVTQSEERIWNSFARIPFESLRASGAIKSGLAARCFFDPQPCVRRVIYIATPHGGSALAARTVGRVGASLVRPATETTQLHDQLVANNPDVFSPQFERRTPTSMDMLEPDDPTLEAIRTLPVSPGVRLHSIIGDGRNMVGYGPGDGVVAVSSALCPGVQTQRFVEATHTTIQSHPDTQAEIQAILKMHLAEMNVTP